MTVQLTVSSDLAKAVAGLVERTTKTPVILSRIVDQALGIPPGVFVTRSGHDRKVKLPAAAADITTAMGGFAVFDPTRPRYEDAGVPNGEDLGMLIEGVIWVQTEGAVAQGAQVYLRHTANGGLTQLGAARADADTANASALPNAWFFETTTAAGLARVYYQIRRS